LFEGLERRFEDAFGARGVGIEAGVAQAGKMLVQFLVDALGAVARPGQVERSALGAGLGLGFAVAAIVAHKAAARLVVGQRHRTVSAEDPRPHMSGI